MDLTQSKFQKIDELSARGSEVPDFWTLVLSLTELQELNEVVHIVGII